jgi:light-regulated signal transduction histidine kinase (bacteriophytochrome)
MDIKDIFNQQDMAGSIPFTSTHSENMRRCLSVIRHHCQLLLDQHHRIPDWQFKEYLQAIDEQAITMDDYIDNLLHHSPVTRQIIYSETVDLGELSKSIIEGLMLSEPGRRVKYIAEVSIVTRGNAQLLRSALKKMINSAWRLTSHKEETILELGIEEITGAATYYIRYNGHDSEDITTSTPFCLACSNDELDEQNADLDFVTKIIEAHMGRIWFESKPDIGNTIHFTLGT